MIEWLTLCFGQNLFKLPPVAWGVCFEFSVWSQSSSLSDLFESSPTTDLPKLEIQAVLVPEIITPGAETELQVQVFIPAGWYIYSIKPAGGVPELPR